MSEKSFYVIKNILNRLPKEAADKSYVHIKCKTDGTYTVIYSDDDFSGINGITKLTKDFAQALLDMWIDEENSNPEVGLNDEIILQSKIDLGAFTNG